MCGASCCPTGPRLRDFSRHPALEHAVLYTRGAVAMAVLLGVVPLALAVVLLVSVFLLMTLRRLCPGGAGPASQ